MYIAVLVEGYATGVEKLLPLHKVKCMHGHISAVSFFLECSLYNDSGIAAMRRNIALSLWAKACGLCDDPL